MAKGKGKTVARAGRAHGIDPLPKQKWDDFAPPFVALVGIMLAGALSHLLIPGVLDSHNTAPLGWLTPLAWMAGFFGLAWHTRRYTTARGRTIDLHLFGTLISAGVATAFLSVTGLPLLWPWQSAAFWTVAFPGLFVALSWDMPRTRAVHGTGKDEHKPDPVLETIGLAASTTFRPSKTIPGEVIVNHAEGQDVTVLQQGLAALESLRKLPAGALTAVMGTHRGESRLKPIDPKALDKAVMWPGPSRPGGSITEPLATGTYVDGEPLEDVLESHGVTMGMTGCGKTSEAFLRISEMLTRHDVVVWWCDPIKGMQSAGPVLPGVDWAAQDEAEAKAMLRVLLGIIQPRTNELGRLGYQKWTGEVARKHQIPMLFVQFEEAAWLMESSTLVKVAERARSAGIFFEMSLQRASHDRMDTSVRANLARRTCYGVSDATDAGFILSGQTLDAGAAPESWRDTKKGALYREASGISSDRWAIPARSFTLPTKPNDPKEFDYTSLTAAILEHSGVRAALDPVTVQAAGMAYAQRQQTAVMVPAQRVPAMATAGATPAPTEAGFDPAGGDVDVDDPSSEDDEVFLITDLEMDKEMGLPVRTDEDEDLLDGIDPTEDVAPIPGVEEVDFTDADEPKLSTEELNELFRQQLDRYLEAGRTRLKASEIAGEWQATPGASSRPWAYMRMSALEREGLAERDPDDARYWLLRAGAGARTVEVSEDDE